MSLRLIKAEIELLKAQIAKKEKECGEYIKSKLTKYTQDELTQYLKDNRNLTEVRVVAQHIVESDDFNSYNFREYNNWAKLNENDELRTGWTEHFKHHPVYLLPSGEIT